MVEGVCFLQVWYSMLGTVGLGTDNVVGSGTVGGAVVSSVSVTGCDVEVSGTVVTVGVTGAVDGSVESSVESSGPLVGRPRKAHSAIAPAHRLGHLRFKLLTLSLSHKPRTACTLCRHCRRWRGCRSLYDLWSVISMLAAAPQRDHWHWQSESWGQRWPLSWKLGRVGSRWHYRWR